MKKAVIDFGSRSAKLYVGDSQGVALTKMLSRDFIGNEPSADEIRILLEELLSHDAGFHSIRAIATEAARRSASLAAKFESSCQAKGIVYETISQKAEADLIGRAFANDNHDGCEIINAGGGSIQIVRPGAGLLLLPFGMSDLGSKFGLHGLPPDRQFAMAVDFVHVHLPVDLGAFIYTGGEETWLRHMGVVLDGDGACARHDFENLSRRILEKTQAELESLSPFDKNWMAGVIASHAIVEGALKASGQDRFFPSDRNIAHGLICEIMGGLP